MDVPTDLKGRDFLRVEDWSADELETLLALAAELKRRHGEGAPTPLLPARTLGMIFDKPSTRTRVSFAAGMTQLGGAAVPLATGELQLGRGETVRDTALVLSRYLDAVVVRTYRQSDLEELARHASIPVVNGLTDEFHPCQALADALTLRERFDDLERVRVAYVGDGNNVCHSLMTICAKLGIDFVASNPPGTSRAPTSSPRRGRPPKQPAGRSASSASPTRPPRRRMPCTPTCGRAWARTPRPSSAGRRSRAIGSTRSCSRSPTHGRSSCTICRRTTGGDRRGPPARPRSAAWDQAENRLHAQKALLALIVA